MRYVAALAVWAALLVPSAVSADATETTFELAVKVIPADGRAGTVTSNYPAIACPQACTFRFPAGTQVELYAFVNRFDPLFEGSFNGWDGPCVPAGLTCTVTMTEDRTIGASFLWFPRQGDPVARTTFRARTRGCRPDRRIQVAAAADPPQAAVLKLLRQKRTVNTWRRTIGAFRTFALPVPASLPRGFYRLRATLGTGVDSTTIERGLQLRC